MGGTPPGTNMLHKGQTGKNGKNKVQAAAIEKISINIILTVIFISQISLQEENSNDGNDDPGDGHGYFVESPTGTRDSNYAHEDSGRINQTAEYNYRNAKVTLGHILS
jgi:hypothetical protein